MKKEILTRKEVSLLDAHPITNDQQGKQHLLKLNEILLLQNELAKKEIEELKPNADWGILVDLQKIIR